MLIKLKVHKDTTWTVYLRLSAFTSKVLNSVNKIALQKLITLLNFCLYIHIDVVQHE